MDIRSTATEAGRTYHLTGRFDAHQVPRFKDAVSPDGSVELDLSGVSFIDSTGLATLVSMYKTAVAQGGDFNITGVQDQVWVIFEVTQLHTVLPVSRG